MNKLVNFFEKVAEDDEEYEKMLKEFEEFKSSLKDMKGNVKQKIKTTDLGVFQKGIDYADTITSKFGPKTIEIMRKWDPDFNLLDFEEEAKFIFEKIYSKYLQHDIEYLNGVCANEGLGYFKSMIQSQIETDREPKFKKILFIKWFSMKNAIVHPDSGLPIFEFLVDFSEIQCMIQKSDPEVIVDGYDNNLEYKKFLFILAPFDLADVGK